MATDTRTTDRVSHILALMKQGDDAFNRRDTAAMDAAAQVRERHRRRPTLLAMLDKANLH